MPVTQHWIPVHSHYASWVADALVEGNRHFVKPLPHDAHDEDVFPEFLLLDAGEQPLPMEISGFSSSAAYEQRKQEKIAAYRNRSDPYWHWDIVTMGTEQGAWPPFPPRRWRATEPLADHPEFPPLAGGAVLLPHRA